MNCACGMDAVYYRKHEGNAYCGACLTKQVENTFFRTVRESSLVDKNGVVAVGVSGGKDSSVLLHLLKKLQQYMKFELKAVSIDEGIAGYRDKSLEIIRDFCVSVGVEHHEFSFENEFKEPVDDFRVKKYCTYCGVLRRNALNKAARRLGANKLAVGHNLDDEAQSILLNVFKGDVNRFVRLGAKPPSVGEKLVQRIKPLRNILEKEITAYAIINKIPFYRGECPYSFDNMRREVLELLNNLEQKRPGTKMQVVAFYDSLQSKKKDKNLGSCEKCGEPTSGSLCMSCTLLDRLDSN